MVGYIKSNLNLDFILYGLSLLVDADDRRGIWTTKGDDMKQLRNKLSFDYFCTLACARPLLCNNPSPWHVLNPIPNRAVSSV